MEEAIEKKRKVGDEENPFLRKSAENPKNLKKDRRKDHEKQEEN